MEKEKSLELRKKIKAKKPKFLRQDTHKKTRLKKKWIRPKGWQSKIRLGKRGYRKAVTPGYGSPNDVKGIHKTGLEMINVSSIKDINDIDPKTQGIIIGRTVGLRKKFDLIKKAQEKSITILNIKNPEEFVKTKQDMMAKKKEEKTKKTEEKTKKKAEAAKKAKEKEKEELAEKVTEEEKKDQEKKEKDKTLTKKE